MKCLTNDQQRFNKLSCLLSFVIESSPGVPPLPPNLAPTLSSNPFLLKPYMPALYG